MTPEVVTRDLGAAPRSPQSPPFRLLSISYAASVAGLGLRQFRRYLSTAKKTEQAVLSGAGTLRVVPINRRHFVVASELSLWLDVYWSRRGLSKHVPAVRGLGKKFR